MRGHRQAMTTGIAITVTMAKYLPRTTEVTETGDVSSSWSVRLRRSSAMDRMVRMGTSTSSTNRMEFRVEAKYGSP